MNIKFQGNSSAVMLWYGMVPFWVRTPSASMQPSLDQSRESSNNPP